MSSEVLPPEEIEALQANDYQKLSDKTLIELWARHMLSLNHAQLSIQDSVQHQHAQLEIEEILILKDNNFRHPEDVSSEGYKMLYPDGDPNQPTPDIQPVKISSGSTFDCL